MENNLFSENQIEYMYSDPSFFRFVNDYFSTFSTQNQKLEIGLNHRKYQMRICIFISGLS